jgi:serine protease Do
MKERLMNTTVTQRWAAWRQRRRRTAAAGVAATALVLTGSLVGWGAHAAATDATGGPALAAPRPAAVEQVVGASHDSYAPLVASVAPAVVTVRSERRMRAPQQFPFMQDPSFREFFGDRSPQAPSTGPQARQHALGSGVIVRPDGYIVTNHHVVDGAEQIVIELADRRTLKAKVIGSDGPSDLAVLKVEATNLPTLPLGNSEQVRVGDVVLALGNPLGVGQTVTMGIVSAKGRATGLSDGSFEDFIQTDAPINQGNSGGALVNTRGELIGINSQILSPSGGNIGIGFAIPANMARDVMAQLIDGGDVQRGKLGITIQSITPEIAASVKLPDVHGALVSSVEAGGPAEKAGLKRGDVIVAIDGATVTDSNTLRNQVAGRKPGSDLKLTVVRNGREESLTARLGRLAGEVSARHEDAPTNGHLGLSVQPVTPETADQLGLDDKAGLLVTAVEPASAADDAGFEPRDVITEVNGQHVASAAELRSAVSRSDGRPALVLAHRRGQPLYLTLSNS